MQWTPVVATLACIALSAHAADVTYDLSGGQISSITTAGSLADGEFSPTFPFPEAFTVDTSTLNGSVTNGIGTFTEQFVLGPANSNLFDQGFQDIEGGSANFTVNYTGATPKVTSFEAGVPTAYASGDIKGFTWGWNYVKTASSSVLTISEYYLSYLGNDLGGATETIKGVNLSVAGGVPAPEMDPASAASAMTLLLGGLAVLRTRKRK
jgi:hypothetical protein